MTLRFQLRDQELPDILRFARSPLLEAVLSLHVLAGPAHHAVQQPWVRSSRALPAALRRRLEDHAFCWRSSYPCSSFPDARAPSASFETELERLRHLDAAHVSFEFGLELARGVAASEPEDFERQEVRAAMERATAELAPGPAARARLLLDDPEAFLVEVCDVLAAYWDESFSAEWARIEPILVQAAVEGATTIAREGMAAFFADMRAVRVDGDDTVSVDAGAHGSIAITPDRPLVLCPSIFVWPHVGVNRHAPFACGLLYPAPWARDAGRPPEAPAALLDRVTAVADRTRLSLLALIAERPRTNQELAALVHMGEAGLSRHLRMLSSAGLVTAHRRGYWIEYELTDGALDELGAALAAFIHRRRSRPGEA